MVWGDKDKSYLRGIPIARASGGCLRVSASSYAGRIQAVFRGVDSARFFKSTLAGLLVGNGDIDIGMRRRNDNSSVVEHVHSPNSVAKERRLNGFLESNRWGIGDKSLVSLITYNGDGEKNDPA